MAPYSEQVIICSGKDDWTSRIEDEEGDSGDFVRGIKGVIGKGGEAFDVGMHLVYISSIPARATEYIRHKAWPCSNLTM
jgi:hypothetical protein